MSRSGRSLVVCSLVLALVVLAGAVGCSAGQQQQQALPGTAEFKGGKSGWKLKIPGGRPLVLGVVGGRVCLASSDGTLT